MPSSEKKPLGKILLQQKLVSQKQLDELLKKQQAEPGRLASKALDAGYTNEVGLLKALSEQSGVPGIDLQQVVIALGNLDLVPKEIAEKHLIIPVLVRDDRIFLAMADPEDKRIVDELEFVTGKKVFPYVAIHSTLRQVIEAAYGARARGGQYWQGPNVPADYLASLGIAPEPSPPAPEAPGPVVVEDRFSESTADDDLSGEMRIDAAPQAAPAVFDDTQEIPVPTAAAPRPAGSQGTILVVDDEEEIRKLVIRVLEERGFRVVSADRGLEALRIVKEHSPDLLVLDAMLPEVHGFDICRRLKGSAKYGHIPVIMISAVYRGWRFAQDLKNSYGVDYFIEKPFRISDLLDTVERAMKNGRQSAAPPDPSANKKLSEDAEKELDLGVERYKTGDIDGAIAHLKKGVSIDPLSHKLHYHLALLFGKKGLIYQAVQELETAVDLQPHHFQSLKNLAVLYQKAGFKLKAVEMWERAIPEAPDEQTRKGIKEHLVSLL
ncbi:MAG: response regulator [Deltaproteobacteria bacterium]|nr:response regulator [Deltaproteobacteria bacterium]